MHIAALVQRLHALGALPPHQRLLLRRWVHGLPPAGDAARDAGFLPRRVLDALPALRAEWQALARVASRHPGADGSERLLLALADGQTVESVLLAPGPGGDRIPGLCVSTQVGCAVGCRFCMTGQGGLLRQLGSAEIVGQVAAARALRPVHKVVFMGMGEPAHNLDAVLEAIDMLGTTGGIGHKNLVLSTVGDERVFERLMARTKGQVRPALALSLHTTRTALREQLLPRAPRLAPAALVDAADAYARASGYPAQIQWTLLDGINDGDDEVEAAAELLAGRHAVLNLIPYNAVDGLDYRRPAAERAAAMARMLHRRGVLTKLRRSAGQDVEAGCGQLRARAAPQVRALPIVTMRPAPPEPAATRPAG
jgi:23S rRNA (adenine2503-C2)-methyltransferase